MRVLCLHGHGTSSAIFETQLTAIREALDKSIDIEYVYIDGPVESDRVRGSYSPSGMSEMVPGPFFGWFSGFSPSEIHESHALITEAIEEYGPFDAIFGFSQGATLALCYLLQHPQPPPVQFAVFFSCAGPAFSSDTDLSRDIIRGLAPEDFDELQRFATDTKPNGQTCCNPPSDPQKQAFLETMCAALRLGGDNGFIAPAAAIEQWRTASASNREQLMTRVFHPALTSARVKIPTVHVLGQSDSAEVFAQAELCRGLSDARLGEMVEHSAAHDVPRKPDEVQRVVQAILAAQAEAQLMMY